MVCGNRIFRRLMYDEANDLANLVEMAEEHVFGTAEANAFCSERHGFFGFVPLGVGSDLQLTILVDPLHQLGEPLVGF